MSADQVKAFLEKAANDNELAAKVRGANEINDLVSAAQAAGFQVEESDFAGLTEGELSDADLENVTGGVFDAVGKLAGESIAKLFGATDTSTWGTVGQKLGEAVNTALGIKNVL